MNPELEKFLCGHGLPLVRELAEAHGVNAYVVGGCLRDLFLGREGNDIDIALSGSWRELPREFASRTGGSFFWLDEERGHARVVNRNQSDVAIFDFAPLRGGAIAEDLTLRDFTINALAVPLTGETVLFDPLGGELDIRRRVVRVCANSAFSDDPLRLVRAFRFSAILGFSIDDVTRAAIPSHAARLESVAGERIRDELFHTLWPVGAGKSLQKMAVAGVLGSIFPPGTASPTLVALQEADERITRLEALCGCLDVLLGAHSRLVVERLTAEVQQGVARLAIMKLALWLSRVGIEPKAVSGRLKLGKAVEALLEIYGHLDTMAFRETEGGACHLRNRFRFFDQWEPAGPELPLLAQAGGLIAENSCRELVAYWVESYIPRGNALLLSGDDVMALHKIPRGKAVGEALKILREAQAMGLARSRAEAAAFLRKKELTTGEPIG